MWGKRPARAGPTRPDEPFTMNRFPVLLAGALLAFALPAAAQNQPQAGPKRDMPAASSAQVLPDFADLVEKYGPAVVNINTEARAPTQQQVPGLSEDDPFYEFFRRFMPPEQQPGNPKGAPKGDRGGSGKNAPNTPRGRLRPFGLGS